ncbi:MAG TPA: bifunctional demethylmenaquinone methyltransferase/2-methoxy-6-polyprenyl-1,4-benzoquinol methylase UbiE [Planctomycetota bacterium]|nr:bifunctional demethylmenaquinone methyltransferase/2-methoxy-6-polyprenyl-1,4-benzoquinol methylase UbiE [Planctomycetota bacterium]MDP6129760.1 bifunctional demethylmenaquinone methyltransferase/2-methoxy-6-polyprenyl-1,4-benzoquinol methylase UbiE [Planctomycetota bacterium]MDP7246136.1 bifunctional demethylmenaquinone methyltransferase/2-methoxy-6-polyprenyl-1,4-benzoquinol methylase UbiE [Planctomycetota bacterium]HJM40568.1 bifunctional demethylmenaquinone methyltransferase/2-methoxy-6-p|tara:strand:- start:25079 stop:25795 length:717 start_codon:yes stop_codon:yes gene_type:complete
MSAPPGSVIQEMFGEIAPQYDFLNRALSFGIDRRWRRRTVEGLNLPCGGAVLDLCCGTGDLALEFAQSGFEVFGADFTGPMLPLAHQKAENSSLSVEWTRADAQHLPFASSSFHGVSIAFGIRNVAHPQSALKECFRTLKPGGKLAVLEFFPIRNRLWRGIFRFYFHHILPRLARVTRAGRTGAYEYLPESVDGFATPSLFGEWMNDAGFSQVEDRPLTGGVARLVIGVVPETKAIEE